MQHKDLVEYQRVRRQEDMARVIDKTILPVACQRPNLDPQHMAPSNVEDAWDAVGLKDEASSRGVCCAVHYVRHLRWKFDLRN